jgi:hypothetical protein
MLTDPLDEAGLRAALASFETQLSRSQQAGQNAFVALAAELTLAERQQLVENMSRRPERFRPGVQKRPGPEAGPSPGARPPYHHIPPEPPPQ